MSILVQISEPQWTNKAIHLASAMARGTGKSLFFLYLIPVQNPALLGSDFGAELSLHQYRELEDYAMIAEDYGVKATLQRMMYLSLSGALIEIVELHKASILFAHLPMHILPLWHRIQVRSLRHDLMARTCQLYTLEKPEQSNERAVSVHLTPQS